MRQPLKVLFAAAEASPLIKVGGLADVAGALPQALRYLGHDVRLIMPKYGNIDATKFPDTFRSGEFSVSILRTRENIGIEELSLNGKVPLYLLENKKYFERPAVYGEADDLERFLLFSLAIIEMPKILNWQPDIVHCHDWHTGMVMPFLKLTREQDIFNSSGSSVFTIHNLAYQGWFDDYFVQRAGLYQYLPPPGDPLRQKVYSMMGLAILSADVVSTVSKTYAGEILTPEYGEGLELVLQQRQKDLYGIVNGLNYEQFNPATDPLVAVNYDINSLDKKTGNKTALQAKAGFLTRTEVPLIGMVGRLSAQKGMDLVAVALETLLRETDIQFVFLGTGEEKYQEPLEKVAARYPARAHMFFTFDPSLAQLVYAGCDMFLMPSRFEPCGLGQLIAFRYGTVPVVRHTGGLVDTVQDCRADLSQGNGFVFQQYKAEALIAAIRRALAAFPQKEKWRALMLRAMKADFSWSVAAKKYEELYYKALRQKPAK